MSLPELALRYRAIAIVLAALLVGSGIVAFLTMPRREDPEFTIRRCMIQTALPGVSAEQVEELVTFPIEEAVDGIDEVDRVISTTREGLSIVYVQVSDREPPGRIDDVWDEVRARVARLNPQLQRHGAQQPVIDTDFGDTAVMMLAIHQRPPPGEDQITHPYTPRQLEVIAERIKDRLALIPAIARAELYGALPEAIYLETDMGSWSQLALTTQRLEQLLGERNVIAPGGTVETPHGRFSIRPGGELDTVSQLERIIVGRDPRGSPVYLEDLGVRVNRAYEDPPPVVSRYGDGLLNASVPSVIVHFTLASGESITELGREVRRLLDQLKHVERIVPDDIHYGIVADQPATVQRKIGEFVVNLVQAVVIVVLVAFVAVGFRMALIMAAVIPIIMTASIGIVRLFGVELEQVTLASLIIALGMLVDNAIQVTHNSRRHQLEGAPPREAAIAGTRQIMVPILVATLTTVAAFLPMLVAIEGPRREYVFSLPVTVSTTLMLSWLVAVTLTAMMAARFIRPTSGGSPLIAIGTAIGRRLARWLGPRAAAVMPHPGDVTWHYSAIAAAALRWRGLTITLALGSFIAAAAMLPAGVIQTQFFPDDERDLFTIDVHLPEGATIAQTDAVCREVEAIVREFATVEIDGDRIDRLDSFIVGIGRAPPRFHLGLEPEPPTPAYAQIIVRVSEAAQTAAFVRDVHEAARDRIPGARIVAKKLLMGPPVKTPIELRLNGPGFADSGRMLELGDRIIEIVRNTPGTWDVHHAWGEKGYRMDVDIDTDRAELAHISRAAVARSLNAFFSGHHLTTFREDDHLVPVYLRAPPQQRHRLADVAGAYVEGHEGKVPIDHIADIEAGWERSRIDRRDLNRVLPIRAQVEQGRLANSVLRDILPHLAPIEADLPPGYFIEIGGEAEETSRSQREMLRAFVISVSIMFMMLVINYNGIARPLLIHTILPLAATGALLGLLITGEPLGFMPMLGMLALAGIVLNTAIVYLAFAELMVGRRLAEGRDLAAPGEPHRGGLTVPAFRECLVEAGRLRLMPIALTTMTTIGGLMPLAFFGGPLWEAMSYVLVCGLLLATVLTLIVLPAMLDLFTQLFNMRFDGNGHGRPHRTERTMEPADGT